VARPPLDLLEVARWPPPASREAVATPRSGQGWCAATSWPLGVAQSPFHFFFLFIKKNKFIYLFFNNFIFSFYSDGHMSASYWFDVARTWHLTESVKFFNRIWLQWSICNYCLPRGPPMNFLNHRKWKIIIAYHRDQQCIYPFSKIWFFINYLSPTCKLCSILWIWE
jgi:hypothetical protein